MRAVALAALLALSAAACSTGKQGPVCAEGVDRCEANRLETCNDDGTAWEVTDDCAAAGRLCVVGVGCSPCVPDALACPGVISGRRYVTEGIVSRTERGQVTRTRQQIGRAHV